MLKLQRSLFRSPIYHSNRGILFSWHCYYFGAQFITLPAAYFYGDTINYLQIRLVDYLRKTLTVEKYLHNPNSKMKEEKTYFYTVLIKHYLTNDNKAGELYYCRKGANTACCFNNHSCLATWSDFNKDIKRLPTLFLKDKVSNIYKQLCQAPAYAFP